MNQHKSSLHFIWKTSVLLLICGLLAACANTQAVEKQPLRIAYTNQWGDYTIIIAKEKGFFAKYGVEVEPVYYDIFSRALPDLASSQLDGGILTLGDTLMVNSHSDLTAVSLSDDGGLSAILAAADIVNIADLKGKQVGIKLGSAYELLLAQMLKSASLSLDDIYLVNIEPEQIPQAIKDNKVQAGFTWEPYTTQALQMGYHTLFSNAENSGLFSNAIVFRSNVVAQRPEDIQNYLKAWFDAVEFRTQHPDESNHLIAFKLNIKPEEVAGDAKLFTRNDNLNIYMKNPAQNSQSVYILAQLNGNFLIQAGSLTKMPVLPTIFDPSFLSKK